MACGWFVVVVVLKSGGQMMNKPAFYTLKIFRQPVVEPRVATEAT